MPKAKTAPAKAPPPAPVKTAPVAAKPDWKTVGLNKPKPVAFPVDSVLAKTEVMPHAATHCEYNREATYKDGVMVDPGVRITVPINMYGDFSSFNTGTVRWGRMRYGDNFIPMNHDGTDKDVTVTQDAFIETERPASVAHIKPTPTGTPGAPAKAPQKKEGVCAFIDNLIMQGGRSADAVLALVLAQFPGRDPKATLATVKTRPSHIKAKGLVPPPFAK